MGKEFEDLPVATRISEGFEFIHEACEIATDYLGELVNHMASLEKDFLETKEGVPARFYILRNAIGSAFIAVDSLNEYAVAQKGKDGNEIQDKRSEKTEFSKRAFKR